MQIGTMELLIILLIAFLVLGPSDTILYARKLGKGLKTLRIYINSFTDDLKETVAEPLQDIQEPLSAVTKTLEEAMLQPVNELKAAAAESDAKLKAPLPQAKGETAGRQADEALEELEEATPVEPADR